jgi:hypothetical protein
MASIAYESMSMSSPQAALKALLHRDYPDLWLVKADEEAKATATAPAMVATSSSFASLSEPVVEAQAKQMQSTVCAASACSTWLPYGLPGSGGAHAITPVSAGSTTRGHRGRSKGGGGAAPCGGVWLL